MNVLLITGDVEGPGESLFRDDGGAEIEKDEIVIQVEGKEEKRLQHGHKLSVEICNS